MLFYKIVLSSAFQISEEEEYCVVFFISGSVRLWTIQALSEIFPSKMIEKIDFYHYDSDLKNFKSFIENSLIK